MRVKLRREDINESKIKERRIAEVSGQTIDLNGTDDVILSNYFSLVVC